MSEEQLQPCYHVQIRTNAAAGTSEGKYAANLDLEELIGGEEPALGLIRTSSGGGLRRHYNACETYEKLTVR